MGKKVAIKPGIVQKNTNSLRKNKSSNGSRREKVES